MQLVYMLFALCNVTKTIMYPEALWKHYLWEIKYWEYTKSLAILMYMCHFLAHLKDSSEFFWSPVVCRPSVFVSVNLSHFLLLL